MADQHTRIPLDHKKNRGKSIVGYGDLDETWKLATTELFWLQ